MYHSIVPPYVRGDARIPRSLLGAVPRLVSAPCAASDKRLYVNFHSLQRCFERLNTRRASVWVGDRRRPLPRVPGSLPGPGADGLHAIPRFSVCVAQICHDLPTDDLRIPPDP
jgi:hypothetical protein